MSEEIDFSKLALHGMKLILSNDWKTAEDLFEKHRDSHVLMASGNSFFRVLQAIMTFEDEKIAEASKSLKETVLKCKAVHQKLKTQKNLEAQYECDIVATDCLLFEAGLAAVNQDISGYLRAGWCLRRAWKNYKRLHKDLAALTGADDNPGTDIDPPWAPADGRDLGTEVVPEGLELYPDLSLEDSTLSDSHVTHSPSMLSDSHVTHSPSMPVLGGTSGVQHSTSTLSLPQQKQETNTMTASTAARLFGAVCFGYGAFHLMISLCPPRVLRLVRMFGFRGDRIAGLRRLELASKTTAMMAPLATLMLIHYHAVIRPFFSLDGPCLPAGTEEAKRLLVKAEVDYPKSALFMYFRGRVEILEGETEKALLTIEQALVEAADQRDTQHICLYEIGRLSMMQMNWKRAALSFIRLRYESRWAKCFYAYLAAISMGAYGDLDKGEKLMGEVPDLLKYKNNQLEIFVRRRAQMFTSSSFKLDVTTCKLLIFEMLYIWTTIPNCNTTNLQHMLQVCEENVTGAWQGLCLMVAGVVSKELGLDSKAIEYYNKTIEWYDGIQGSAETLWPAFATFELATIYSLDQQNHGESRKHFQLLKTKYRSFDFDQRLSVKVAAAVERMQSQELTSPTIEDKSNCCAM